MEYHKKFGYCIVAYQNSEVVYESIKSALARYPGKVYILCNGTYDENTFELLNWYKYLYSTERIEVLFNAENVGCNNGFAQVFDYALKDDPEIEYLIKADDSFICPKIDWEKLYTTIKINELTIVGTNFFGDGRLKNSKNINMLDSYFSYSYCSAEGVISLPWGIISKKFFSKNGIKSYYVTSNNEKIEGNHRLYGGEEAYWSSIINSDKSLIQAYLLDVTAERVPNELLDPDYQLWKYVYGFIGCEDRQFSEFRNDIEKMKLYYLTYFANSDNDVHQLWASKFMENYR